MGEIGETKVEVKIDDKATAMLENVCKQMNRSAMLALVSAIICAACTAVHGVLLYLPK